MLMHQACALLAFLIDQSELSTWDTGRKYWTINIWIGFLCLDYPLRIFWDILYSFWRLAFFSTEAFCSLLNIYPNIYCPVFPSPFGRYPIPMKEVGKPAHRLPLLHPNSCILCPGPSLLSPFFPDSTFLFCSKQWVFFWISVKI